MSRYAALYDAILVGDAKGSEASVRQAAGRLDDSGDERGGEAV